MKIGIIGGAGFIGEHVQEELRNRRIQAVVLDRRLGDDVTFPGGLTDRQEFIEKLQGCDSIIHLAGVLGTAELFDNPGRAIDVNVKGAVNILNVCKEIGANFVGISMPECWPNVYQATKHCAKMMATAWHQNFGLGVSHVRAYNAFGIGQKHGNGHPQKIIPTFAKMAWRDKPIPIWGDGTQRVDLVHVSDIAKMLVDATKFHNNEVFDAGTGEPLTVNQVAAMVANVVGKRHIADYMPMRKGEMRTDATVAKGEGWQLLGWKPTFDMKKFTETVRWYA